MTIVVNMHEAKSSLSKLVDAIERGEEQEIVIARNGKPAVKLVPLTTARRPVRLGLHDGKRPPVSLEEFNAHDKEIADLFYGSRD